MTCAAGLRPLGGIVAELLVTVERAFALDPWPATGNPYPAFWRGRQWVVTAAGLDAPEFNYEIDAACLGALPWFDHLAAKSWVTDDAASWENCRADGGEGQMCRLCRQS